MADPLTCLKQWQAHGFDRAKFLSLTQQRIQEFQQVKKSAVVLLVEDEAIEFLAGFVAAIVAGWAIVLGNPHWVEAEWQQVWEAVQPDLILGNCPYSVQSKDSPQPAPGWILVPTGGSSGQIRFAVHTWETLTASVEGFRQYFQVEQVNSCCVLPLYHVSGLMQFLRSFISNGQFAVLPFKDFASETKLNIETSECFLSLVPTQLQRLLQLPKSVTTLQKFQTVLLGGAPAWSELLEQARQLQIRLAPTYGMTETASQIVTLKPEDFLRGNSSCGRVLPHAQVTIDPFQNVTIQSKSLALGYYPDQPIGRPFKTDDLGFFEDGYLYIAGRSGNKIITGGENVFAVEVEAAIRASGLVSDVCVVGMPDRDWGEVVTAVYVPIDREVSVRALEQVIESALSKYKRPKHWYSVDRLPRNLQGKLIYPEVKRLLTS